MQDEVASPFRKKRGTLVKLKTIDTDDSDEDRDQQDAFNKIQPLFTLIESSFDEKKQMFDDLKNSTHDERVKMFQNNELQDLRNNWLKSLELHIPEAMSIEQKYIDQFKTKNQDTMKDINAFILILSDWLNNVIDETKNSLPKPAGKKTDQQNEESNIKKRLSSL